MKLKTVWTEKMRLTAESGPHSIPMDAKPPFGEDAAPTPKELLVSAVCGCTAMDVIGLLKKHKQTLEALTVEAEAFSKEGSHPAVFEKISLLFKVKGTMESEKLLECIQLSQSKFCSVSAMLWRSVPISYNVELNGSAIGSGAADFTAAK